MIRFIQLTLALTLISGCISDKGAAEDPSVSNQTSEKLEKRELIQEKSKASEKSPSDSNTPVTAKLEKIEEKAINDKVLDNQKRFEEKQEKEAEARRKKSKYKEESCDILIKKIEQAVEKAISNPDDEDNLKFLYEINLDQTNADCKKNTTYNQKFQALMKKWDES